MMPRLPATHRAISRREQEAGWASRQAEYRGWYASTTWRRLRRIVLERDAGLCKACGCATGESGHVDHIEPHRGDWERFTTVENLQVLCHECHSKKTVREGNGVVQK